MSIEQNIQNEANLSSREVKNRAHEEVDEDKRKKQLDNDGLAQDMDERKTYAHRIFILICMWLCLVSLIL